MSWSEIKKSVNSNLAVPLNEKIELVNGILERGLIEKSVTTPSVTRGTYTLLNVQGKGCLLAAGFAAGYNTLTITIDGEKQIILNATSASALSISTNLQRDTSTASLDGEPVQLTNSSAVINHYLFFEKSLAIVAVLKSASDYVETSAYATYALR